MADIEEELIKLKEQEKKKQEEIAATKKKIEELNKQLDAQKEYEKKLILEEITLKQKPLEEMVKQEAPEPQKIEELYDQIVNIYKTVENKGYLNNYEQDKINLINETIDNQAKNYSLSEEAANKASAIKSIGKHLSYQNIYK
jgi:hypothetical protein